MPLFFSRVPENIRVREEEIRGGSRTAASSKMKRFVIIVFGWMEEAVSYYHKALHLGCCSSPRSASVSDVFWGYRKRSVA